MSVNNNIENDSEHNNTMEDQEMKNDNSNDNSDNNNDNHSKSNDSVTANMNRETDTTTDESDDEVFNYGKNVSRRTDGPVRLYYYSPMKLPYTELAQLEMSNEDEIEFKKKLSKRFISSIMRREEHVFHHYLGTFKIDINATGGQSWTPIMFAIQKKRDYFVKHLLYSHSMQPQSGNNEQAENENENENENKNEKENKDEKDEKDRRSLDKYLLKMGIRTYSPYSIDLQFKDPVSNRSMIHLLCERGDAGILEKILKDCENGRIITEKPILIDDCDKKGQSGFYIACVKGFDDVVTVLLKYGANPNLKTAKDGFFGLLKASEKGHRKVVEILMQHNKNIFENNNDDNNNNNNVCGNICDINAKDGRGRTGLMVACAEDRRDIVKMFIDYEYERVDLNATDSMNFRWNCLMWSIFRRNGQIARMLISCDLDINYWHRNSENKYVLDMCNEYKSDKMLKLEIWLTMMKRYFRPAIAKSTIIQKLNVPNDIVDVLCKMLY